MTDDMSGAGSEIDLEAPLDPLTMMPEGAPLPQAGSWPLSRPQSGLEAFAAVRRARERVARERRAQGR